MRDSVSGIRRKDYVLRIGERDLVWGIGGRMTTFGDVENLDPRDPNVFSGTTAGKREMLEGVG